MKKVLIIFSIVFVVSLSAVIIGLNKVEFREEFKVDWKSFEMNFQKIEDEMDEKVEYLSYKNSYDRKLDANDETFLDLNDYNVLKVISIYDDIYIKQDSKIENVKIRYEAKEGKEIRINDSWDYRSIVMSGIENKDGKGKIYIYMPKRNTFKLEVTTGKGNIYFDKIEVK